MKSAVQAIYLMTSALGNLVIVIVTKSLKMENLAYEMFMYASVMCVVAVIFSLMAIFYYEYRKERLPDADGE